MNRAMLQIKNIGSRIIKLVDISLRSTIGKFWIELTTEPLVIKKELPSKAGRYKRKISSEKIPPLLLLKGINQVNHIPVPTAAYVIFCKN
jgi:hypothetical protein